MIQMIQINHEKTAKKKDHKVGSGIKQNKYYTLVNLSSAILCNDIIACYNICLKLKLI